MRTPVRSREAADVLTVHEIESFRRSRAMAPLSVEHVRELLDECDRLVRAREQIALVLADLPESVAQVRQALNRLSRIVA